MVRNHFKDHAQNRPFKRRSRRFHSMPLEDQQWLTSDIYGYCFYSSSFELHISNFLGGIYIIKKGLGVVFVVCFLVMAGCTGSKEDKDTEDNRTNIDEQKNDDSEAKHPDGDDGLIWGNASDFGVVLSHGAVYDAKSWEEEAEKLADEGMTVYAVEDTDPEVLIEAADMLKDEYGAEKTAIIGASAGGQSTIDALVQKDADFDQVVLLSPGGDATEIEDIPVLVIYSEDEGFDELEENKGSNIETIAISGNAHAQELFDDEESSEKTMDSIIEFLEE